MKIKLTIILLSLITLFSFTYAFYLYNLRHVDISTYAYEVDTSRIVPTRLVIKSLGVDLPIYESEIIDGKWEKTKKGVSYLTTTPLPGDTGNSIIYGHNWENLLGKLDQIENGNDVKIIFSDGSNAVFNVKNKFVVTSDQTHILKQSTYPKLTMYTCSNFLDAKRLVVTATPRTD